VEYLESKMKINEVLDEKIQQTRLPPLPAVGSNNTSSNNQSDVFTGDETKVSTFIGPNAKVDWNPKALRAAELAVKRGESRENIWLKYGTLWAADRLPRQEISNHKDKIINKLPRGGSMSLSDFIHVPEVYKNYPHIANATITHDTSMDANTGAWARGTGEIGVGANPSLDDVLHEIQHLVDNSELHSAGQSPDVAQNIANREGGKYTKGDVYWGSTGERGAFSTGQRQPLTPSQRRRLFPDQLDTRSPHNFSYIHVNQREPYGKYEIRPLGDGVYAPQTTTTTTTTTPTKPKSTPKKSPTIGYQVAPLARPLLDPADWKANENK
jgi:hypothetical protein